MRDDSTLRQDATAVINESKLAVCFIS